MNKLFFELIRLTIGTSNSLSRQPSSEEWQALYKIAVKQCLIGICFMGVRRLVEADKEGRAGIPKQLYYNWMGMAANIQQRNEELNKQCRAFELLLKKDGYQSCVLKGQGIASLYKVDGLGCRDEGMSLAGLRQSGDIDTWALGEPREVIEWARQTGAMTFYDYHHADLSLYRGTEIELHYRPSLSRNLMRNYRLQRWFREEGKQHIRFREELGFSVPDYIFNVVLTMSHNFWHLMYEGVGLRQILDLYFVLKSVGSDIDSDIDFDEHKKEAWRLVKHFRLQRFAAASMWIMREVLGLDDQYLICSPGEKAGRFLLNEIMLSGNFGKFDQRLSKDRYQSRLKLMLSWLSHNFRLIRYYPADVLWTPLGVLRISMWRHWNYRKEPELK